MKTFFELSEDPVDVDSVVEKVRDPSAGGLAVFLGTTRNTFDGKAVDHLEYEAYRPMAEQRLEDIGMEIADRWPDVRALAIRHRLGRVEVGEVSVAVAVSAPHRAEALEACGYGIDRLKALVPIWKKEVFADGEVWRENITEGGEPP